MLFVLAKFLKLTLVNCSEKYEVLILQRPRNETSLIPLTDDCVQVLNSKLKTCFDVVTLLWLQLHQYCPPSWLL